MDARTRVRLAETNARVVTEFGDNLLRALEDACLSQRELARLAGAHADSVGKLVRSLRSPNLKTIGNLATALGISIPELLTRHDRAR